MAASTIVSMATCGPNMAAITLMSVVAFRTPTRNQKRRCHERSKDQDGGHLVFTRSSFLQPISQDPGL